MNPSVESVAVILYDGCTIAEVAELASRLAGAVETVEFVGPSTAVLRDQSGLQLVPDRAFVDLAGSGPDLVVVPGGNPESAIRDASLGRLLSEASERGSVIAGICAGVVVMASAGVLEGRRITHNYRSPWAAPEVEATVAECWTGTRVVLDRSQGVVVDENVVTALPNASIEFAVKVCELIGLYSPGRAALIERHLRGEMVEKLYRSPD